jgi:hypothetical protein
MSMTWKLSAAQPEWTLKPLNQLLETCRRIIASRWGVW